MAQWETRLHGMRNRVLRPGIYLTKYVIPDMEHVEKQIFESQGRRGGGSWKRLDPEWVIRKIREGMSPEINIRSGQMLGALTNRDASHAIRRIVGGSLIFGSSATGTAQSQRFRPVMKFTKYDRQRWARLWLAYITEFK